VASTYCTVIVSPALAAGPVPVIKSVLSSWAGGGPEGTLTVGSVPNVPAGERSATGMVAIVVAPDDVVAVDAPVVVVDELAEELPHPASPRVAAVSTTSDQVRKRGIGEVLSGDSGMTVARDGALLRVSAGADGSRRTARRQIGRFRTPIPVTTP
jgi:hypothetical protein